MGNNTADVKIRILAEDQATKELKKTDKSLSGFGDAIKGIGVVAGVATAAVIAFNKAFDFAQAGAEAEQMADSFDYLMMKVGATPGILNKLRDASLGTISDLDLMASTSLLLAGTQGELATELANATPQLLEMAKAANKLNPSLGDTTFLYDSLARGIKRGSPMILDNLGIMVSLEEANKKYADSLGVSVDALSKEQQQVALLNEVLGKGNVLIEQAGGNAASAADEYMQFKANLGNLAAEIQQNLNPSMEGFLHWANEILTTESKLRDAFSVEAEEVAKTAESYDGYVESIKNVGEEHGIFVREVDGEMRAFRSNIAGIYHDVTEEVGFFTEAMWESKDAIQSYTGETGLLSRALENLPDNIDDVTTAQQDLNLAIEAGLKAGLDGKLAAGMTEFSDAMLPLEEQLAGLQEEMANLFTGGGDPTSEGHRAAAQFQILEDNIAGVREEMEPLQEALANVTRELIYNQAAAGLDAEAALDLARSFGLLSEQDYVVATSLQELRDSFDANKDGAITAAEGAEAYTDQVKLLSDAVLLLQNKGAEVTFENLADALRTMAQTDTSGTATDLDSTATSAGDLLEIFGETPDTVETAEQSIEDIGTTLNDVADNDVQNMITQLEELKDRADKVPDSIRIHISQTGAQSVLDALNKIKKKIEEVANQTASIPVPEPPKPPSGLPVPTSGPAASTLTPTTSASPITINSYPTINTELDSEVFTYTMASRLKEYIR